jgi:hypothetical protein
VVQLRNVINRPFPELIVYLRTNLYAALGRLELIIDTYIVFGVAVWPSLATCSHGHIDGCQRYIAVICIVFYF